VTGSTIERLSVLAFHKNRHHRTDVHPLRVTALREQMQAGSGVLANDRGTFFQLTVSEHFKLAVHRKDDGSVLDRILDKFPKLRSLMDRKAGLLSGGEQQMLALAKALVVRPRLLLIDEMSLGLAPIVVQSLLPIIRDEAVESNMGVVLVEQHIDLALRVADQAMILNHGHVVVSGAARDLLARRDEVEAAYLGRG
jgi:branched-chain amino acid transport system ATP-binding protein